MWCRLAGTEAGNQFPKRPKLPLAGVNDATTKQRKMAGNGIESLGRAPKYKHNAPASPRLLLRCLTDVVESIH